MDKFKKLKKIERFITDNNLTFDEGPSCLNSDCCTISGFALHVDEGEGYILAEDIIEVAESVIEGLEDDSTFKSELERVFDYAYENDYGNWWTSEEAKTKYNF